MSFWKITQAIQTSVMKVLFASSLVATSGLLSSEWDPSALSTEETSVDVSSLHQANFELLKNKVLSALKNSWCSEDKAQLLLDLTLLTRPQVCVDIGSFTGSTVLPVAAALQYLGEGKIYAIDAWSAQESVKNIDKDDPNYAWWVQLDMNSIHKSFMELIRSWSLTQICTPVRLPSNIAVKRLQSIDFLHLDGNFSEEGSLEDVQLYLPKVKSGGYILLSNVFHMAKGKQTKMKAFCALFDSCELVAEIDHENTVLFRKL